LRSSTVADLLISRLRDAGVRTLFGVPGGGSNLDVIEAARHIGIPFVLTATETAAAIAAIGQAEVCGRPGACLTALGPGVASAINGIACARLERAPLIVISDGHPASSGHAFEHQRLDHHALVRPLTKWSATIEPSSASDAIDRAIACAIAPPAGPAYVELPSDVASMQTSWGAMRQGDDHLQADDVLSEVCELRVPRRPLIIAGLGARRPDDVAAIRELSSRRGIPVMVTYKAKGVVPDDDPWFAGVFTNGVLERPILDEADLIIGAGLDPIELIPREWKNAQQIVYCGRYPVDGRHVPFKTQRIGDVATILQDIASSWNKSAWDRAALRRMLDSQRQNIASDGARLSPSSVVRAAAAAAPHARVTVDAGAHMFAATLLWPVAEPNGMLISNGLSTMGFALPAAVGAASIDRARPVVALTGDGGLLMCAGELLTIVREHLPVIVVVFNDASLSLIAIKQQQRALAPGGVSLGTSDWATIATGLGLPTAVATTARDVERAIGGALTGSNPLLVDARIDAGEYGATLRAIRG
jgi:acetolactate synthase-1/2/3 large subunit